MIIAIHGKARAGKDTVADYLVERHDFTKYSLAYPIKKACKEIFLLSENQLYGDEKEVIDKRYGSTPRELLQIVGTELFREHLGDCLYGYNDSDNIWVNRFTYLYNDKKNYVIPDLRFQNEYDVLKQYDTTFVKVVREGVEIEHNGHKSEDGLDDGLFDYMFFNKGNKESLYEKVHDLM